MERSLSSDLFRALNTRKPSANDPANTEQHSRQPLMLLKRLWDDQGPGTTGVANGGFGPFRRMKVERDADRRDGPARRLGREGTASSSRTGIDQF